MDLTIAILISLATSILGEFTIVAIICKLFNKKSQGTPYPECNRIKYFNYWKWITKLIKLKFMPLWYKQAFNSHWTSVIFLQKVKLLPFVLSFQVAVLLFVNQIKAVTCQQLTIGSTTWVVVGAGGQLYLWKLNIIWIYINLIWIYCAIVFCWPIQTNQLRYKLYPIFNKKLACCYTKSHFLH